MANRNAILAGACIGGALAIPLALFLAGDSLAWLPRGEWLFNNESCSVTRLLVDRVSADPKLRSSLLVVPVAQGARAPASSGACALFSEQLEARQHWLRWLPQDRVCARVSQDALSFVRRSYVAYPGYARDGVSLPASYTPEFLATAPVCESP